MFGGLEPDLATVLINCRVGHHGGRAIAHQFVKKPWRFRSRFRSSKLALDWEDMLPQPRKQLAFPARDDRVLRQMRVAIDQSGKNCHSSSVEPTNGVRSAPAQIIIVAAFRNLPVVDDHSAVGAAAQSAEFWRVDQEAAEAERASVALHKPRPLSNHFGCERRNTAIQSTFSAKKKIRAAHAKEKQQIQKRATTRIALTC